MTSVLGSAIALGFLGSLHCTVMCGPLAIAGCRADNKVQWRNVGRYLGARVVGYAFAGAVFGLLGAHAAHHLSLPTVQRALVALVAVLALGKGLSLMLSRPRAPLVQIRRRGPSRAARLFASLIPRKALALGLVTGALPCGLLVGGWALAASTGHPLAGAGVMTVFCLATAPALVLAIVATGRLGRLFGSPIWHGALWCALGLWIGARPLLDHMGHGGH